MSQDNKQLALQVYELVNERNTDAIGELVAEDYREHDPLPGQGEGREGVRDRFSILSLALAPKFTVEDVIAEGDRVVVRWTNSGTHIGAFAGIPPTGKSFVIAGIDVYRVADGKLAEHWHVVDQLAQLQQLGVIPAPAEA